MATHAAGLQRLSDRERSALLAVAPNFRDAGGVPTASGRRLRSGVLFRSSQLDRLAGTPMSALERLGVSAVYDLRTGPERAAAPDALPASVGLVVADVLADNPDAGAARLAAMSSATPPPTPAELNSSLSHGRARAMMLACYEDFIALDSANQAYRCALTGLARGSGALVLHCTAGKDRTGWGTAVVQLFLGVPESLVMADYLESNQRYRRALDPLLDHFERSGGDRAALADVVDVRPEYLETALSAVQVRYGSLEAYLSAGLGLAPADLAGLESRLLP